MKTRSLTPGGDPPEVPQRTEEEGSPVPDPTEETLAGMTFPRPLKARIWFTVWNQVRVGRT